MTRPAVQLLAEHERSQSDKEPPREADLAAILALPHAGRQMTLDTGACDVLAKYVLLYEQPDQMTKPIGYCYCSLKSVECVYDTTQRE